MRTTGVDITGISRASVSVLATQSDSFTNALIALILLRAGTFVVA
jgi:hypothetical protein